MPKLEVVSHEYDAEKDIDHYVFNPGNMDALVKIVMKDDGTPEVLLGVQAMAVQIEEAGEPTWTVCANPAIKDIALADWEARQ